ncbi:MAG TPA: methionyl-tRNA formyltransferase [Burkholderiales bacterium]|nr:methionyl-tRNA formyltransferase [Burkholderiales bacterium]
MQLAFAGTAEFARQVLGRLLETPHEVVLVLSRPDTAAGRGLHVTQSPVKQLAVQRDIEVLQPASLKLPEVERRLREVRPDLLVVVAYGLLIPGVVLAVPRLGAVNVHASLLPRWRGAAPIQRALLAGDVHTGVSVMKMDEGLDTGPVFAQRAIDISSDDDAGTLHDKLARLGGEALVEVLGGLSDGRAQARAQPEDGVTYAAKIDKRETELDWRRPAAELERAVRAFRPAPGALARLGEERVKIWRAALADAEGEPGTVLDARELLVACGSGALRLLELQRAGGRRVSAAEFLRGRPLPIGTRFG